jgi:hypothetical protein
VFSIQALGGGHSLLGCWGAGVLGRTAVQRRAAAKLALASGVWRWPGWLLTSLSPPPGAPSAATAMALTEPHGVSHAHTPAAAGHGRPWQALPAAAVSATLPTQPTSLRRSNWPAVNAATAATTTDKRGCKGALEHDPPARPCTFVPC